MFFSKIQIFGPRKRSYIDVGASDKVRVRFSFAIYKKENVINPSTLYLFMLITDSKAQIKIKHVDILNESGSEDNNNNVYHR